ncbi:two-component system cell cycle response regulator CtrA [Endobacter medicaginis]|jgi:two-component system, cell cycle response regulator CtrA|uniref:Response regulator transcription factor n=1 Tax=Endobacter medicaginis TaxID=1181271 RepID=A0A850NJV0_9PROT|nr:response regulator transcription factor [Endobacter medicaginis]MBB3174762.1 two-component system cell cycle response regulator CtrA [Endobacter medicaginis]NVN30111.1 response regulator transcription factor [Endobacter medicaginis]
MRVLMVENDLHNARMMSALFESARLTADVAESGDDALEMARHYDYDIVVTASDLPDMDGVELLRRLRLARNLAPVMMIGAPARSDLRLRAFATGADDVMAAPVDPAEFLARLRAIVRRSRGYSNAALSVGNITLHMETREAAVAGRPVHLTGKEYAILELLVLRKGMVLTKDAFLSHLYGGLDEPEMKIIDVFVCKLRKKLALAGADNLIATLWGRGYMLREETRAPVAASAASILSKAPVAAAA